MIHKLSWTGFLRRQHDSGARILLMVGGSVPEETRLRIEADWTYKRIDQESYDIRMENWKKYSDSFHERVHIVDYHDPKDWITINCGAYMRRTHLESEGSGRTAI